MAKTLLDIAKNTTRARIEARQADALKAATVRGLAAARSEVPVRSGALRASIVAAMTRHSASMSAGGKSVPYARIQEKGGTVKPKHGQFLAVPLQKGRSLRRGASGLFSAPSASGAVLAERGSGNSISPVFALVRQVTLKRRGFMAAGFAAMSETFEKSARRGIADAIVGRR